MHRCRVSGKHAARRLCAAILVSGSALAHAIPITVTEALNFATVPLAQSQFSPGGSAAEFGASGKTPGNTLGISYETRATSGSATAHVNGNLEINYDSDGRVAAPVGIGLKYTGLGSSYSTLLGAYFNVKAFIDVGIISEPPPGFCIVGPTANLGSHASRCLSYSLATSAGFNTNFGVASTGADSLTAATAGVGPDIVAASATAGVDLNLDQDTSFTPLEIVGNLVATNTRTGEVVESPVTIDDLLSQTLFLDLTSIGVWEISLVDLALANIFSNAFDLSLVPFVQYTIGLGCGDPGTDSDNGVLCAGDGRADFNLASISVYDNEPFALSFNTLATDSFLINVVPEPGALTLLAIGILLLGIFACTAPVPATASIRRETRSRIGRQQPAHAQTAFR